MQAAAATISPSHVKDMVSDKDPGRFFIMPDESPICAGHVWHASVIETSTPWSAAKGSRPVFVVEVVHIDHTLNIADVCYLEERRTKQEAQTDLRRYVAPPFLFGDVIWRAFEPNEKGEPTEQKESADVRRCRAMIESDRKHRDAILKRGPKNQAERDALAAYAIQLPKNEALLSDLLKREGSR